MDRIPTVTLEPLSIMEGNETRTFFTSVRLSVRTSDIVTVDVEAIDETAVEGEDYVGFSGSIEFQPGSVQENMRLQVIGDEDSELDENFQLRITQADGAEIGVSEVTVVMENDGAGNGEIIIPTSGYITPEQYPNMDLIWSDEFCGTRLNSEF